jgi:hypothetical protein
MLAGCDTGNSPSSTSTFCGTWLELTKSGQDAALDRQIREWASEGERKKSTTAQFLACMAERTRAQSYQITEACRSNLRGVEAPAALGRVIVRAGQFCAGVDMY